MVAMPFLLGVIFLHYFKLTYTLFDSYYSQIAQISIDLAKECLAERYEKYSDKSWKCVFFNRFPRIITSFSVFHVKIERLMFCKYALSQMQVNTKVSEPPLYLYTKVGEPPHQSRCKSTLWIDLQWSITDFGGEEQGRHT